MIPITKELKEWAIKCQVFTIQAYSQMIEEDEYGDCDDEAVREELPLHKEFLNFLESIKASDG